ncbi:hypothetical protein JZO73_15440 [Enterococcus plantarum]|uniref:hypothetical protein n=1 Tax=Enterococcus plantarum TaxID=1077675 RepID=UPI001A8E5011|nr:hypothetical protein [Enterococcus plantarum]MBO0468892.1 hypothetical protein [Enterococcus plantarum]
MRKKMFSIVIFAFFGFLFVLLPTKAEAMTAPFLGSWIDPGTISSSEGTQFNFHIVARNMRLQGYEQPTEAWEQPEIYVLLPDEINLVNMNYDKANISAKLERTQHGKLVRFIFKNSLKVNADWSSAPRIDLVLSVDMFANPNTYTITKFGSSSVKNQNYPPNQFFNQKDYSNLTNLNDPTRDIIFREYQTLTVTP